MPNYIATARSWFRPRITQTAGTVITSLIQAANKLKTKVTRAKATCGVTAHTLTFLRPLGSKHSYAQASRSTASPTGPAVADTGPAGGQVANAWIMTAVAAGGTSYVLSRDPGNYSANFLADKGAGSAGVTPLAANNLIAASDLIAVETQQPGVLVLLTVSGTPSTDSATGRCTVTATAAPTGGIPAGAAVFFFGVTTDTDPRTGEAHPAYLLTASAQTDLYADGGSICETVEPDEPILAYDNNATNAGSIDMLTGMYGP